MEDGRAGGEGGVEHKVGNNACQSKHPIIKITFLPMY